VTWKAISLLIGAYLLGSIPTAYLAGRWLKGIDIRQHATGNVGGSNVWHSVTHWAIVPVGLFDVCKAALPAWLALGPLELGYPLAIGVGLCAALGHAWSPFLGLTGGRERSPVSWVRLRSSSPGGHSSSCWSWVLDWLYTSRS